MPATQKTRSKFVNWNDFTLTEKCLLAAHKNRIASTKT